MPDPITPQNALEAAEALAVVVDIPDQITVWIANMMLTVEEAATSGCPCRGCQSLASIRNSSDGFYRN